MHCKILALILKKMPLPLCSILHVPFLMSSPVLHAELAGNLLCVVMLPVDLQVWFTFDDCLVCIKGPFTNDVIQKWTIFDRHLFHTIML